jgi:hypothetical protein
LAMAMYSNKFVGLPKKRLPSAFAAWGESNMSDDARYKGV